MECIYIVEDDASIQEIELIALKNSNYDVHAFSCAADFFAALKTRTPQLILLDIMLPDADGNAITRTLRSNAQWSHIPIIMLTAKTTEMDRYAGLITVRTIIFASRFPLWSCSPVSARCYVVRKHLHKCLPTSTQCAV